MSEVMDLEMETDEQKPLSHGGRNAQVCELRSTILSHCRHISPGSEWTISDMHHQLIRGTQPDVTKWAMDWLAQCIYHKMISGTRTVVCLFGQPRHPSFQWSSAAPRMFALKPCFIPVNSTASDTKTISVPSMATLEKSAAYLEVAVNVLLAQHVPHVTLPVLSLLCKSESVKRHLWKREKSRHKLLNPAFQAPSFRNWKSQLPFEKRQKKRSDFCLLHVVEYVEGGSLFDYCYKNRGAIATNVNLWVSLLGQMCACLAMIQERWPHYRHNDCHLGNWLAKPVEATRTFSYKLGDCNLVIPSMGVELLLWDFEHSTLEGEENFHNPLIQQYLDFGMSSKSNRFFDMHTLLDAILIEAHQIPLAHPATKTSPTLPPTDHLELPLEVTQFLKDVLSDNYLIPAVQRCGRLSLEQQHAALSDPRLKYKTPRDLLLYHPFFQSIRPSAPSIALSSPLASSSPLPTDSPNARPTMPMFTKLDQVLDSLFQRQDVFNQCLDNLADMMQGQSHQPLFSHL